MEIALVGNPNSGKTTLFNALTGSHQRIGNWPGVTVEKKTGTLCTQIVCTQTACTQTAVMTVVDLPGVYSLHTTQSQASLDERIACDYILSKKATLVVNILDASHLERSLYLTMQLLEMGVPLIVAVNMLDVGKQYGFHPDLATLSQCLGCPVIGLQAHKAQGVSALCEAIVKLSQKPTLPTFKISYPPAILAAIATLQPALATITADPYQQLSLGVRLLEGDAYAASQIGSDVLTQLSAQQAACRLALSEDIDIVLADSRYGAIVTLLEGCVAPPTTPTVTVTDWIDRIVLNRFLGIPIFLAVMYALFVFAINVGGAFQDFFDGAGQTIFVEGLSVFLHQNGFPAWMNAIFAGGMGVGITTTLTFIPVIGSLFLFLAFLETSGYMARAAFIMDRLMRGLGLPGKSFVPLIVGFGCNVPAVMATRTLENPSDRLLTIMMSPFMSCGARLAIYAVFVAAFFPTSGAIIIFLLYIIGIGMAIMTGLLLRKSLFNTEPSPLVMELPPYHIPTCKNIFMNAWHRLKSFLTKASKVIIPLCMLIGFLNALTVDGQISLDHGHKDSVLSAVGQTITPIFAPMGITQDNWPATVGIATGMLAKEVVVATLNTLYTQVGELDTANAADNTFNFWGHLKAAAWSILINLSQLSGALANPIAAAAPGEEVTEGVYGQMVQRFDGRIGAFAYLLFLLLYFPCVSTTAAMVRELNVGWTLFSVGWTTGLAYASAVIFYQLATFTLHPYSSLAWLVGIGGVVTGGWLLLRAVLATKNSRLITTT